MKHFKTCSVVALLLIAFVTGCTPGTPSEAEGRRAFADQIAKESNGLIKLVSFEKTDGVKATMFGQEMYGMSYNATVETPQDCYWASFFAGGWKGHFFASTSPIYNGFSPNLNRRMKKGERLKLSATLNFFKTEKGWQYRPQEGD